MNTSSRLQDWVNSFSKKHQYHVDLTVTQNRRSMITVRKNNRRHAVIRLHEAFEEAPEFILQNLEIFLLTNDSAGWKTVAAFARAIPGKPSPPRPRPLPTTQGKHIDLVRELAHVKRTYFACPPEATIAWGKAGKPRRRKRRSIRFGSWHGDCSQVRIHPLLDQEWVPLEFIHYLIYHELCHAAAPPFTDSLGRHHIHHASFKALEKKFPQYSEMESLSKEIFRRLVQERR